MREYNGSREYNGLYVKAKKGEDVESLLVRFKKKLKEHDRFLEIRKHDYFIPKSQKRRQKQRRRKFVDGTAI